MCKHAATALMMKFQRVNWQSAAAGRQNLPVFAGPPGKPCLIGVAGEAEAGDGIAAMRRAAFAGADADGAGRVGP